MYAARVIVALLAIGGILAASPPKPLPAFFMAGASFAMTNDPARGYDSNAARAALDALKSHGVTAISVMPFAFQRTPSSPGLRWKLEHPASESDAQITAAVTAARARGLAVLVKPHIWVPRSWPGAIQPASEKDFAAWWRDYRDFILHHAALAGRLGAEGFCVGTELSRVQDRPEWSGLVADVRRVFPGFVVYAANWDRTQIPFADLLDAVGVDLYAPLSTKESATDAELSVGAARVAAAMEALSTKSRRPLLLTEVGFPARPSCWAKPNEESRGGTVDVEAQRRSAKALLQALSLVPSLKGLFWWKVFSDGEPAGPDDSGFRITGRPAEKELFDFFAGRRLVSSVP